MISIRSALAEALSLTEKLDPSQVVWYRGTDLPQVFGRTDTEERGTGHQNGPGWYLTTNLDEASEYSKVIHQFRTSPKARYVTNKVRLKIPVIKALVMAAPELKEIVWDWDEHGEGNVTRGVNAFLKVVSRTDMADALQSVQADFYKGEPDQFVANVAKYYDAFLPESFSPERQHMVLWNKDVLTQVTPQA